MDLISDSANPDNIALKMRNITLFFLKKKLVTYSTCESKDKPRVRDATDNHLCITTYISELDHA